MSISFPFWLLHLLLFLPISSPTLVRISKGSSLSVEKTDNDVLVSRNGVFAAGFYPLGENAFCLAIWYKKPLQDGSRTVVWMANRDDPVNGRLSKLSLLKSGNLILKDSDQRTVWSSDSYFVSSIELTLLDPGNLVLRTLEGGFLWQSFLSPTDTLLPSQRLTRNTTLVSSRSKTNSFSGFYKLYFDDDNVLQLLYEGPEISSVYWPLPLLNSWEGEMSTYNNSKIAQINYAGYFSSSDGFSFSTSDYGMGMQRRLTLDPDGNVRVYSLDKGRRKWEVSWQAISQPCIIHGICGQNALCTYNHETGRRCTCLPRYKIKNATDWSYGCEPDFKFPDNVNNLGFLQLPHVHFCIFDILLFQNVTLEECKKLCLMHSDCKGFKYKFGKDGEGFHGCFPKNVLFNGYRSPAFEYPFYLKLTQDDLIPPEETIQEYTLNCSTKDSTQLERAYEKKNENGTVKFLLWFVLVLGGLEGICVYIVLYITRQESSTTSRGYLQAPSGFKRFTFAELKKASCNFSVEIGRGGGGIVYKGILDDRAAAIKLLKDANQGEAEFLAEVSTIGRLNHMNLMDIWGYCAEGKRRLLVSEYMDHGSLAENLHSIALDWEKRFDIAVGTAKGLAYIHEECLEWFLHCDVKPQNILLDNNYKPKVADFGLSKLLRRDGIDDSRFSTIRGTRGYMAPEWVFSLPITYKIDVYSYGIVVLEMITGRSPTVVLSSGDVGGMEQRRLVSWVRRKMHEAEAGEKHWIEEIVDSSMNGEYDREKMEFLVKVAMQCAEEDKDGRPTMSQVVDMLLFLENHD